MGYVFETHDMFMHIFCEKFSFTGYYVNSFAAIYMGKGYKMYIDIDRICLKTFINFIKNSKSFFEIFLLSITFCLHFINKEFF